MFSLFQASRSCNWEELVVTVRECPGTPKEGVKRCRCNEHSTKDHGTQIAMPEILARGVEKNLRQREEKLQKENMTILPLIDVALETAVFELAASKSPQSPVYCVAMASTPLLAGNQKIMDSSGG
ncbi:hypothetical protein LOD99_6241 [Oopsacas minuta]|uniref:Uncharacterized protein n=1 Tax=Oopsacas minuta TaxID=111878 RepID=A0AAV7JM78_9METZ|nr:hypothetical protein LOD99_6241 [Oopsacas minuta]